MTEHRIDNVVIYRAERLTHTVNGNPRYRFHTSAGPFLMQNDAALGYAIDNYLWSEHKASGGRFGDTLVIGNPAAPRVTLLSTGSRRVYGIEYNGEVLH